jgi:hypothetical protein
LTDEFTVNMAIETATECQPTTEWIYPRLTLKTSQTKDSTHRGISRYTICTTEPTPISYILT